MKPATSFASWPAWLGLCGGFALAACQYLIYIYAPVESTMGVVQKIFYVHLPLAWWALISGGVACVAGIAYLHGRQTRWDHLAHAGAELTFVLSTLVLITGSIWARHSWGVWWTWDPRLTTALVLWFLYAGYLVLRHLDLPAPRRAVLCSVVGIVAFLDVPLVFFSARFWRSIHPAVFASEQGGLDPAMRVAAIASVLAFGLVWWSLLVLRARSIALEARGTALAARLMDDE